MFVSVHPIYHPNAERIFLTVANVYKEEKKNYEETTYYPKLMTIGADEI